MSQYLADAMQAARRGKIPRNMQPVAAGSLLGSLVGIREKAGDLGGREIYAFDLSALNAAADLRIDTPERIERLVEAVLRSPRRMFLEADLLQLGTIGANIRGVLNPSGEEGVLPSMRWGAFVDIEGEGRARYQVALLLPGGWMKSAPGAEGLLGEMQDWPAPVRGWGVASSKIFIDDAICTVDMSRRVGISKSEFSLAIQRIRSSPDPIFRHASTELERAKGPRARGRVIDAAWQAARFRDLVRLEKDVAMGEAGDALVRVQRRFAEKAGGFSPVAFGLPVVALLALLQADSSDIRTSRRPRGARDGRKRARAGSGAAAPREMAEGLRVVTLNLEDRELQAFYERSGRGEGEKESAASQGSGRVRHPVRGHLFLARNGRMTWRRPHWRGSLEQPTLRRVVAPSHER